MDLYKQFKTAPALEREGILLEYGMNDRTGKPVAIRIARAGGANAKFARVVDRLTKPYRQQIKNEAIDTKVAERLLWQAHAEAVVLGWENVDTEEGVELPFTIENCVELFSKLPELFKDIQEQAGKMTLFRAANLEADAGN